ncbi:DUF397 domain-containing protein [Spirillospora sp. NPDC029432]|uniref:DUF397 domain-containing protein n=1 Tax=Spirillospora sp. NPDC029432 TaxID=3154599 RepID=UPI003455AB60
MSTTDLSGARWCKGSRSDQHGGDCVEVAGLGPTIAVRDSKDPEGPMLTFDATGWSAFARQVKAGRHDLG